MGTTPPAGLAALTLLQQTDTVVPLNGATRLSRRGERHSFSVGGGGAQVEAETFGGRIRLVRPGGG